jgi:Mg2+/citrate symporter
MDDRPTRSWLEKLRDPHWRWLRIPVGVALVVGGILGFLPLVGFWMIPLGLSLLAVDFPAAAKADRWIARKSRSVVAWLRRRRLLPPEKSE